MRQGYQQSARIGHGRQSCLGNQACIFRTETSGVGFYLLARCVLIELQQFQLVDVPLVPGSGKETACRPELFDEEEPKPRNPLKDGFRQDVLRGVVAQGRWDQVEFAFHRS